MKTTKWITIDCDGKNARITSRATRTEPYEICFPITMNIPPAYFVRPVFSAKVTIPAPDLYIEDAVIECAHDAILEATGIEFKISVERPNEEETPK